MTSGKGPPVATTVISAAWVPAVSAVKQTAVARAVIFDLIIMTSSLV
jgi:hypothetical protein